MSKIFSDLTGQTRTYLDEALQADWKDTEVKREVNNGYQEIITAVMETYENYYLKTAFLNTKANQQEYAVSDGLPENLFKIVRVEINFNTTDPNAFRQRAKPVDLNEVQSNLDNNVIGISLFRLAGYYLIGNGSGVDGMKLGFLPVPLHDGTNAIKLWYIPEIPDMVNDTDNVNIPYADRYASMASLYAAATLLRKGQQEESVAEKYMSEFEFGLKQMKQQLEDRISDNSKSVTDVENIDVDFSNYSTI